MRHRQSLSWKDAVISEVLEFGDGGQASCIALSGQAIEGSTVPPPQIHHDPTCGALPLDSGVRAVPLHVSLAATNSGAGRSCSQCLRALGIPSKLPTVAFARKISSNVPTERLLTNEVLVHARLLSLAIL